MTPSESTVWRAYQDAVKRQDREALAIAWARIRVLHFSRPAKVVEQMERAKGLR